MNDNENRVATRILGDVLTSIQKEIAKIQKLPLCHFNDIKKLTELLHEQENIQNQITLRKVEV